LLKLTYYLKIKFSITKNIEHLHGNIQLGTSLGPKQIHRSNAPSYSHHHELLFIRKFYTIQPDNILIAYPSITSTTDTLYLGGKTSFLAANTLTIIFLAA
jgi:hypothetical protein